jgi:hypothetical protein
MNISEETAQKLISEIRALNVQLLNTRKDISNLEVPVVADTTRIEHEIKKIGKVLIKKL